MRIGRGAMVPAALLAMLLISDAALGAGYAGQQAARAIPQPGALQRADTAFRAGYAAMQAGRLEDARKQFAEAARLAPQLPEARVALGAILVQLGRPAEAIPELEKALALKPGDAATEANLAAAYEAQARHLASIGKLPEAEGQLFSAIKVLAAGDTAAQQAAAPQLAMLQDELGSALAQQKRWSEAETAFRKALSTNVDETASVGTHMHLGVVLLEEKLYPQALTELNKAVESAPGNAMTQFELGRGLAAVGKDDEAVPHLQEALKLSPELPGGALELAMAVQRLGRQAESIPLFQKAVDKEPRNAMALTNLGLALTQTGKAKEAVPFLQRALAETPNDPVVHENLGVAELQQSHFDEAIVQFEKARELDAESPQLHYDLGLAYKLKDRMDDAVRELAKAASLDPTLPDPPYTLGILYMQLGRQEDAVKQLRTALVLRPTNGDGWAILGSVLKQMDRRLEAEEALRKAVELLPDQPGPHITLASVLAEQGKSQDAAAERKVAANLSRTAVNHQRAMLSTNAGNQSLQRGEIADAVGRYQDAIAADPGYVEAHGQLAVAYERQGRTNDAAAERAKAVAITKGN